MYLWSISAAKQHGYPIDESLLKDTAEWLLSADSRAFPRPQNQSPTGTSTNRDADKMTKDMMGARSLSQPTIYLMHAFNARRDTDGPQHAAIAKIISHLATAQREDGSFAGRDAWRPIFNTPQILTRFVVAGLQDASPDDASHQRADILEAARSFLEGDEPDSTHQGIVLRILCEPPVSSGDVGSADSPSARLAESVEQLRRMEHGGWSQTPDRAADAFATGQSLVALHRAGVPRTDPIVIAGIDFLIRTQNADGTWTMTSRPNPENGKPAENLNPITYAATAWATLGMARYNPIKDRTAQTHP
jgi:hypothetical protein